MNLLRNKMLKAVFLMLTIALIAIIDTTLCAAEAETAASEIGVNHLEVDYTEGKLVMPSLDGYTVTVHSSSDTSVIGLDGSVDITKRASVEIVLTLTSTADSSQTANTAKLDVVVNPMQSEVSKNTIVDVEASSNHSKYIDDYLIDGSLGYIAGSTSTFSYWANSDSDGSKTKQDITIVADMGKVMPIARLDICPIVKNGTVQKGPKNFTVSVSKTGEDGTWVECIVKSNQVTNADGSAQTIWLNGIPEGRYVKLHITKFADGESYVQIGELEIYSPVLYVSEEHIEIDYTNKKLILPEFDGYTATIYSSSDESVIGLDGSVDITKSATVKVELVFTSTSDNTKKINTGDLDFTINPLQVEAVKQTIVDIEASSNHSKYIDDYLIDGSLGYIAGSTSTFSYWANSDSDGSKTKQDITIVADMGKVMPIARLDICPIVKNGTVQKGPKNFTVSVSKTGEDGTWVECIVKSNQVTNADGSAQTIWLNGIPEGRYVKLHITKFADGESYVQIGELEIYSPVLYVSEEHIEIDYTNKKLILPEFDGYTATIYSSSDESVIGLDGSVDITKNVTVDVVLTMTSIVNNSKKINTGKIAIAIYPRQVFIEEKAVQSIEASSNHSEYVDDFLIDGSLGYTSGTSTYSYWANSDADAGSTSPSIEIVADMGEIMPIACVDICPFVKNGTLLMGPKNFSISVSETGENGTWVECLVKTNQVTATDGSAQRLWLNGLPEARYIKLHITKYADGERYVQIGEIKVYAENAKTAEECLDELSITPIVYGDTKVEILGDTEAFEVTITQSSNEQVINLDGTITFPEKDTEVTLTIMAESKLDGTTAEKSFTVTVKSEAQLLAESLAEKIDLIELPANDATEIIFPTTGSADYEVSIVYSDNEDIVALDGTITRPEETTGVYLKFRVSLKSDASVYADTEELLLPVYKPYDPIVMTDDEIAAIRADFEAKSYGVFVHYISEAFGNGGSVKPMWTSYVDGSKVLTVDDLAEGFNAEQFAKDMHDFGAEWVVFTCWHADTRTLFPSMTNKRWRDDRREVDENGNWVVETAKKTYSDRDVIDELITELDKYDIDLHLYIHPFDGVFDFTTEDRLLTGADDKTNYYEVWNIYANELVYEMCERYRDRIKGIWIDGHLNGMEFSDSMLRVDELTASCTSFYPAMLISLNGGLDSYDYDNVHNGNATTTHSIDRHWGKMGDVEKGFTNYMSWEINPSSIADYTILRYSKNHSATVLARGGWFAMGSQTANLSLENTVDMFRYIVALKSKSTMGGFLASTGFYPVREQDLTSSYPIANGDYWRKGIRDQLVELNEKYMTPVAESVRNTIPSTAYLSHNDDYVAMLEWGVATESRDGKYVYLHVLNAPESDTLTIPKTTDRTKLISEATVIGFDGSRTAITLTETSTGYSITLPDGMSWSEVDTVIRAERETASFGVNAEEISFGAASESFVLKADADKVIFVSSDTSVATVDENGIVTAIGEGTATITVINGYNANNIDKTDLDAYNPNYTVFVKVTVLFDGSHTHNFGTEWVYDGNTHYHLCVCGAKTDIAVHTGGAATCKVQAVCDVCKASYGDLSHHGGTATCSTRAICATCGEPYGDYAPHAKFVFDSFSGRFVCEDCGAHCEHTSFANGVCNDCGFTCNHDWQYNGNKATCSVCSKVCTSHGTSGLDFKCATCGYDNGAENSFSVGSKTITDGALMLNKYHKFDISFGVTFGSTNTVVNVKDESRNDNIYFNASESANTVSEYFSVITWINNQGAGNSYLNFISLWLDTNISKLYLVKNNDNSTKICEVTPGVEYVFDVEVEPTSGKFNVTISQNGTACGTLSGTFNAITKQLVGSQLRFGEAVNAKQLHVQKIAFDDIYVDFPEYENGVCVDCSVECAHIFNMGGHCVFCGEFGNAITFADGANGGGNIYDTNNDGKLDNNGDKLTEGNGVYLSQSGSYKQLWDYRDESGSLLGRNYVFSGTFNFSDWQYVSTNGSGTTRLLIWADGDVNSSTTEFALYFFGNNGTLQLGPDHNDPSTRMDLELNRDYDIRVAMRSTETSEGVFSHIAEIYVDGALKWIREFNLTADKGMSIRIGDHTPRQTQVKYSISKDFGIHCLDSEISFIGTQQKEDANYEWDTKYDLRFIFALDDLYLNDVGVKVEAEMTGGTMYDDASGELTASSSRTVLNGIMANGEVRKPGSHGTGYGGNYLALAITDIPLDSDAIYTFTLTPYVTYHGGETVFSESSHKITVSFIGDRMNIGYEKAE